MGAVKLKLFRNTFFSQTVPHYNSLRQYKH